MPTLLAKARTAILVVAKRARGAALVTVACVTALRAKAAGVVVLLAKPTLLTLLAKLAAGALPGLAARLAALLLADACQLLLDLLDLLLQAVHLLAKLLDFAAGILSLA